MQVLVEEDDRFVREEYDVHTPVEITMLQAALGCVVAVPDVYDEEIEYEFEPGTQPGLWRCTGQGRAVLGGRGQETSIYPSRSDPTDFDEGQLEGSAAVAEHAESPWQIPAGSLRRSSDASGAEVGSRLPASRGGERPA